MLQLALDLKSSATLLGTDPDTFLDYVQREQLAGVIKLNGSWRVSIFTLAALLNTTPANLLELLEDYMLGQLLEAVESDEWFEDEAGQQIYQSYLTEAHQ
jgi:hypothetical protein